jgi:hypothetical protein
MNFSDLILSALPPASKMAVEAAGCWMINWQFAVAE